MTPIEMIDAGIRAMRASETGHLSYATAAQVAQAWAALAQATVSTETFDVIRQASLEH